MFWRKPLPIQITIIFFPRPPRVPQKPRGLNWGPDKIVGATVNPVHTDGCDTSAPDLRDPNAFPQSLSANENIQGWGGFKQHEDIDPPKSVSKWGVEKFLVGVGVVYTQGCQFLSYGASNNIIQGLNK